MHDLVMQFFPTMPTGETWLLGMMSSLFVFVAARNTRLRRERRQQQHRLADELRSIERERKLYQDEYEQKKKRMEEQWATIQEQSMQLYDLNQQVWDLTLELGAAKQMHLNLN